MARFFYYYYSVSNSSFYLSVLSKKVEAREAIPQFHAAGLVKPV